MNRSLTTLTSYAAGHVFSWPRMNEFAQSLRPSFREFISDALAARANRILERSRDADAFAGELIRRAVELRDGGDDVR